VSYVQQIDQTGNIKTEQSEITEIIDNGSSVSFLNKKFEIYLFQFYLGELARNWLTQ
jgi:hypothetical protein